MRLRNILFSFILVYFIYHVFQGDRGVVSLLRIKKQVQELEIQRDLLQKEQDALEKNVYLLKPDSLDLDLLEERAKAILNFSNPSEIVIKK